jgi:hypothetical protein
MQQRHEMGHTTHNAMKSDTGNTLTQAGRSQTTSNECAGREGELGGSSRREANFDASIDIGIRFLNLKLKFDTVEKHLVPTTVTLGHANTSDRLQSVDL